MNNSKLYVALSLSVLLSACSLGKNTVNLNEVKKVKSVAVIMYTVPEQIVYRDDVKKSSTSQLAEDLIGKNGGEAANAAVISFTETLQKQGLPFKVMTNAEVMSNADFVALYKPATVEKKKVDDSLLGQTLSFLATPKPSYLGSGPVNMNQYGLVTAWGADTALTGKPGEDAYIKKAIEALKVDAVLVVNDTGFSFSCEACIGIGDSMSGAASTGSAFNATLITRSGPVMNIREWFGTTDDQAPMLMGIVDPTEHTALFEEHGRRMAEVFSVAVKEEMLAKN